MMGYNMVGGMGGMGGYGGGMGGMGGAGGSSQMLSSMCSSVVCASIVGGAAFYLMNKTKGASSSDSTGAGEVSPNMPPPGTEDATPTTPQGQRLDGSYMLLVGSLGMNVDGDCANSTVIFRTPKDSKTAWNVRYAGQAGGKDYYTIQSDFRSFSKTCAKQYLTAPVGCTSGPYLDAPQSGPSQYFFINTLAGGGYSVQNVACAQSKFSNYLQTSGQEEANKPNFTSRTGSVFALDKPYAG